MSDFLTYFTIITGIATLVSLVLQLSGSLMQYKAHIRYATVFLAGITIGLLANVALSVNVHFPVPVTAKQLLGFLLYGLSGLLASVLFVVSVATNDPERRVAARNAASAVSGFLVFILLFFLRTFFE